MKVTSRLLEIAFQSEFSSDVLVSVDVAKIDRSWQTDYNFYITPGGGGHTIGSRYKDIRLALEQNPGMTLDAPIIALGPSSTPWGPDREVRFQDGRHRFAALRDLGYKRIRMACLRQDAPEIKKRFGA